MRLSSYFKSLLAATLIFTTLILTQSCVHEVPALNENISVKLKIKHDLTWEETDYYTPNYASARNSKASDEGWSARYIINLYPRNTTTVPVKTIVVERPDLTLADFVLDVTIPAGDWDIYVWQDFVNPDVVPPYYDVANFGSITYSAPYRGDTDKRDAFEGFIALDVPKTIDSDFCVTGEIVLERPLAKYVFIATDFEKFYNESLSRWNIPIAAPAWDALSEMQKDNALKQYSIVAKYAWYMPAVYDIFTGKVTDSWSNMYYDADIKPLNNHEAAIAMDYVMINHMESGAQVQLGMRTPDGQLIGLTSTITVPLKRGQITYVRGDFLTASTGSGLEVDFSFSDNIDIFIH